MNETEKTGLDERRKNALFRYIGIMFIVAFVLVLLSLFGQLRDSQDAISQLNQSSTSALAKAQELQDNNRELETSNAYLTGRIEELEERLEKAEADLDEAEQQVSDVEQTWEEQKAMLIQERDDAVRQSQEAVQAYESLLDALESGVSPDNINTEYLGQFGLNVYNTLTKEGE